MRVWLVTIGEALPLDAKVKKHRTGLLADALHKEGHEVFWWTSAFDHFTKKWLFQQDTLLNIKRGYTIFALKGTGYQKNVSLSRFIDHRVIAGKFKKYAPLIPKPEVIVAASPAYDLAYQAVTFAVKNSIPVIVDIRDEWPELFLDYFPYKYKKIGKLLFYSEFKMFSETVKKANALVAMMQRLLEYGLRYAKRQRGPYDRVFYLGGNKISPCTKVPYKLSFLEGLKGKFMVTFVGSFVYHNDPAILVDTANELRNEDVYFILAGDGELFGLLHSRASHLHKVFMPGWLNEEEISFLLSYSSVGVAPTPKFRAAFPNKIFSYLSAGLPIISAFEGELRDIIEKHKIGFYFPPNDKKTLANCILELYNNPQMYKEFSNNASKLFEEAFDAEKIYTQYVEHIRKIVEVHNTEQRNAHALFRFRR